MARPLDIIDPKKDLDEVEEHQDKGNDKKEQRHEDERGIEIEEGSGGGALYLVLGIVAIVLAAGFAVYVLYKDQWSGKDKSATTATATATVAASAAASTTASVAASTTTLPVTEPTSTGNATYASSPVKIANGNGITGEATRIKGILEAKGFKIDATGNASKNYDETIIYYNTGKSDLGNALKTALAGEYSATVEESSSVTGNYDAVVALGKK